MDDDLQTTLELARELKLSHRTLERWRSLGIGPPYVQAQPGGPVRYRRGDTRLWRASRTMISPSQPVCEISGDKRTADTVSPKFKDHAL